MKTGSIKAFLLSIFLLATVTLRAQTFDEWFRQKETQREYLVQQIAALQAYAGVLREGYTILRQGISTVEHIKNGDLGLHQAFFGSLTLVSPAIAGSARVADILSYHMAIARDLREALPALRRSGQLKENELEHLEKVKARVLASCARDLEELWLLLAANEREMSDAGRLQRLEALYGNTRETFRFTRSFLKEARVLPLWRAREQQELEDVRTLQGLPQ
ncbi:hypothetical protein CLV24_1772 [Pontibacter ummariensis]|uniref:hypothetical protein n=1 Tax=Pontibacter ummariensis TaxID=1610492 RepID=UPI000D05436D|nr:hypothetical protein [Pontibacter ummariensis]PRX96964.1 hypothetical protein CLV24_1772 [Pontibacter ummariensis]